MPEDNGHSPRPETWEEIKARLEKEKSANEQEADK